MGSRLRWLCAVSLIAAAVMAFEQPAGSAESIVEMSFTEVGSVDFTVPPGICAVTVDTRGAAGGSLPDGGLTGGRGGEATSRLIVPPGTVLRVTVGGKGQDALIGAAAAGGFNGGGAGGVYPGIVDVQDPGFGGGGGGGASDVRTAPFGVADRLVVAGGGGGSGNGFRSVPSLDGANGGDGGGPTGERGHSTGGSANPAAGGGGGSEQAAGEGGTNPGHPADGSAGSGATGGNGADQIPVSGAGPGGGGGAGWFGGGGGASFTLSLPGDEGGGGGGSGFTPDGSGLVTGINQGDGTVTITYDPAADACTTPPPKHEYPGLAIEMTYPAELPKPGTTFIVHVQCGPPGGGSLSVNQDFTFFQAAPPTGRGAAPPTGYSVKPNQDDFCTVNQTADGGATSVAYSCNLSGQPDSRFCQPSGNEVHFDATAPSQSVVNVTVLNTFISPIAIPPSFAG